MARKVHIQPKFVVEEGGLASASFMSCSELSAEVAEITYFEGGSLIPIKEPGLVTFADVTLERGTSQNRDLYNWLRDVADVSAGPGPETTGLVDPLHRRNLSIVQRDRDNTRLRAWDLYGAWPKKFVAGTWGGAANELVMESVTLAFDRFDLVQQG